MFDTLIDHHIYSLSMLSPEKLGSFQSRMSEYYRNNSDYQAFIEPVNHPLWYDIIVGYLPTGGSVLEVGAGKGCFGDYLSEKAIKAEYHSQDITSVNHDWLAQRSAFVWNCPLSEVSGSFDLIFSTYVYEHLADPAEFLNEVDRLLKPGGVHIVIGPNYDIPGYLSPSLRHLSFITRLRVSVALNCLRLGQLFRRKSYFLINTEPAFFSVEWYRDADACHIVSQADLVNWCREHNYSTEKLHYPGSNFRDWLFRKVLVLQMACRKSRD